MTRKKPPALAAARRTPPFAPSSFPIVGIGASAGGLDAFRRLLGALPADTGMAYVLVQHLDPHHESILAELLSETSRMGVFEVQGDVLVEPNRVNVLPPSKGLLLEGRTLKLVPRVPAGTANLPIDAFLRSLAAAQKDDAIGVILSGMGADGTLGLQAIASAGGIAFAQAPASAKFSDMPSSAIATGGVDFILTPEEIAGELARLGHGAQLARASPSSSAPEDHEGLASVLAALRDARGTDFSAYKKTTLQRRIGRRMVIRHIETLTEYAREITRDATEAAALYDDCLISVTAFFRDPEVFASLSARTLPLLLKDHPADSPVRVWVPGCATGEEVYSLAMCLLEVASQLSNHPSLQIFATDLSDRALARARDGTYPESIAADVSPERLRRFFSKTGAHYQINKAVREMCIFARHDVTRDPPYSRMNLISCRNLLIYLEPQLQESLFATFHYALRPEGFLVIGPAETLGASSALFSAVDEKHRIYGRTAALGPRRFLSVMQKEPLTPTGASVRVPSKPVASSEVPREADQLLLARFGPAAVVIDAGLRVLQFRGDTDPFLEHSQGKASLELERLLRNGLLMPLRQAIEEARRKDAPARREGLRVRHRTSVSTVSLEVIPIKGRAVADRCLLVVFETPKVASVAQPGAAPPTPGSSADDKDREISRLGEGLAETTDYMHALVREHEVALEELQSTNEEALSSNEELQSVNEELQTAKEEVQSANEELATLNEELSDRNVELAASNEAIQRALHSANALVDTVRHPLVILDDQLRIERANASFYATFRVDAESTQGRPLAQLGSGQWNRPALLAALGAALATDTVLEDLELTLEFPTVGLRDVCVNARRLHAERGGRGRVLVAIEDRTDARLAEGARAVLLGVSQQARERAEAADHLKDEFVATVSHELRGPLNVISGWTNVLLGAGESPDGALLAKALAAIARGVTAQGRLLSDLLDHSRLVTGKLDLQRVPIDLLAVAHAAVEGVRVAAEAKDIAIVVTGARAAAVVIGDFDRLQQVLWNLCFNAVKFTPAGGSVHIAVGRIDHHAEVAVTDTGRGIPPEFVARVFDRFRQAEGSTTRAFQGLGLGLTLVREIVELHGGTVRAESDGVGRGATFRVLLPIPALLLPLPSDPLRSATRAAPSTRVALAGTRVLVVDDEAEAREALAGVLEGQGAHVRSAGSVAEAMEALRVELPDVLVSDIGMPGEDGYELVRRVRLLPPGAGARLPVIALSAYTTEDHRRRAKAGGFDAQLPKPVVAAELIMEVARLGPPGARTLR